MRAPRGPALLAAAGLAALLVLATAPPAAAEPVVDLGGTAVDGSPSRSEPTPLDAGLWADTLAPLDDIGDARNYRYDRAIADSTVRVGVVAAAEPDSDGASGELSISTPDGTDCSTTASFSAGYPVEFSAVGASAVVGPDESGDRSDCVTSPSLVITVERAVYGDTEGALVVALKIAEEAPVASLEDLPRAEATPDLPSPATTAGSEDGPDGSISLDDAADVGSSTWTSAVTQGEQRFWRVRLDWGEGLSVGSTLPPKDAAADAALGDSGSVPVEISLLSPMRASLDGLVADETTTGSYEAEATRLTTGLPPVAYRGRFEGDAPSTPGDYWIAVAVAPPDDGEPLSVPIELTTEITGSSGGEPDYVEAVTAPGGGAGPGGYDASTPFLVAADTFAADPSGNPVIPPDAEAGAGSTRRWWGAGVAVVSLLACAAGVWRLRSA